MDADANIVRAISIDTRLDSYATFFDHGWARQMDQLASGTAIDGAVFDLCYTWKSIANAHVGPWLLMHCMKNLFQGVSQHEDHAPSAWKIVKALREKLLRKVPGLTVTKQQQINQAIEEIVQETQGMVAVATASAFSLDDAWGEMIDAANPEFRLSIWGTQRLCYAALYHAYEDFVRHLIGIKLGDPTYRIRRYTDFIQEATKHFGSPVAAACISDADVNTARLVRHALAHNGGRVTSELGTVHHGITVLDGVLQVQAPDTKALFDCLKGKAYRLAEAWI